MTPELKKLEKAKKDLLALIPETEQENARNVIADLLSAQAQSDIEAVELIVPTKSVQRRIDLGPLEILDTTYGILFNAKGTMSTLLRPTVTPSDHNPSGPYGVINALLDGMEDNFASVEDEDTRDLMQTYAQAWLYILQAPLFASLSVDTASKIATLIIEQFTGHVKKFADEAELQEETKEDALLNAAIAPVITADKTE